MSDIRFVPLAEWSAQDVARNIVNQIFDQVEGLTVEERQRLNDPCDRFVTGLLDRWLAARIGGSD